MRMAICRNCGNHIIYLENGWAHPTEYSYDSIGHLYYAEYCSIIGNNYQKATPRDKSDGFLDLYETLTYGDQDRR